MKYAVNDQIALSRAPEGPLVEYIGLFADFLSAQGYALKSIHRQVYLGACFSQWLKQKGVELHGIISDHPRQYLRDRARQVKPYQGDAAALKHVLDFLRNEGVVPAETVAVRQLTPVERCTQAYEQYLRETRVLAEATIINYVPFISGFLSTRFADEPVKLSALSARDVVNFVHRQAPRLHQKRAKLMTSALRSFLQYARYCGEVTLDLAAAVPVVPNWSMPSIPRAIAPDQVRQLLASIDQRTATGRRDYAVLLLLARLGLRSSEVALERCIPLAKSTRAVMKTWLKEPSRNAGEVLFPSARGQRLSVHGVQYLLNKHRLAGGKVCPSLLEKRVTVHRLRHTMAMDLLQGGVDRSVIALWLGHESVETTQIYLQATIEIKAQALAKATPTQGKRGRYQPGDKLLNFLNSL